MTTAIRFPTPLPREITLLTKSLQLLEEAESLDEIRDVRDKAEALRLYTKQQREASEIQNAAAEIKVRAERRAGKLLFELGIKPGQPRKELSSGVTILSPRLSELGISRNQSSNWQAIAGLPDEDFDGFVAHAKVSGREITSSGLLKIARQADARQHSDLDAAPLARGGDVTDSLPSLIAAGRKFHTVYADPPWRYGNQGTRASTDNHYDTMSVDDICAEPVSQLVEDDAHLHLWTTNAFLPESFRVMESWGFEYKSVFVWCKPQMGIGNYWRVSHEFMLFGIRGKQPFRARDEMSWAQWSRGKHSAKPDAARAKVERVSPGPYLEMYGRVSIPNSDWTIYGNQVKERWF